MFGKMLRQTRRRLEMFGILVMHLNLISALLGIDLFNSHWGQGIGKEVGKALPQIIFNKLGLTLYAATAEDFGVKWKRKI